MDQQQQQRGLIERYYNEMKYYPGRGSIVQAIIFLNNVILLFLAFYLIGFSIVVGLSSGTISTEEGNILDWISLTPSSLLMFYGIPLLVVSTFGLFATYSPNYLSLIGYVVLVSLFIVYDIVFGLSVLSGDKVYINFLDSMKKSQNAYYDDASSPHQGFGIIPVHSKAYWDHLQKRGKCCGLYSYEDWKNTTMAVQRSVSAVPDSCCSENYQYTGCGVLQDWKQPDHKNHSVESKIYLKGCLSIFPSYIKTDKKDRIDKLGRLLVVTLSVAIIGSIALFTLTIARSYRTVTGLNIAHFQDVPADLLIKKKVSFDDRGPVLISPDFQNSQSKL